MACFIFVIDIITYEVVILFCFTGKKSDAIILADCKRSSLTNETE